MCVVVVTVLMVLSTHARSGHGEEIPARSGDLEKRHNSFDAFEHLLLHFVAFGYLGRRPLSAGRKQPFKGRANCGIGVKMSGNLPNSSVISVRSRPIIAANGIGKALDQGVQEKALRPLAVPKKVLPTVHNETTRFLSH
jgi:hypothetical protein